MSAERDDIDDPSAFDYLEGSICGLTLGTVFWFQFVAAFSKELAESWLP